MGPHMIGSNPTLQVGWTVLADRIVSTIVLHRSWAIGTHPDLKGEFLAETMVFGIVRKPDGSVEHDGCDQDAAVCEARMAYDQHHAMVIKWFGVKP